jgi:hypothetical protein
MAALVQLSHPLSARADDACGQDGPPRWYSRAVARKLGFVAAFAAMIVTASIEALLLWLVGRLPTWAQVLVYGVPIALLVVGLTLAWIEARKRRRLRGPRPGGRDDGIAVRRDRRSGPGTG